MTRKENFINTGFSVVETEKNENGLLSFLKENYPQTIRDNEIKWDELKTALGLPVDEKVNGYGLNFIGRNVAKAKYAQKTAKELKINKTLSKNFDTTQNMVLKGDNLDCLKILKSHYSGKIKCIYIDPPYNTAGDQFIYPDKFDKEEAEVLGLANISESDFERMEFSFQTKKSHNGWLSFMYPRLMLARDLLSNDGVIFISIDDNEQANLKLLCDEIFGEENFVANMIWQKKTGASDAINIATITEYIIVYAKNIEQTKFSKNKDSYDLSRYKHTDEFEKTRGAYYIDNLDRGGLQYSDSLNYGIECPDGTISFPNGRKEYKNDGWIWKWSKEKIEWARKNKFIEFRKSDTKESGWSVCYKNYLSVDNENQPIERAAPHKNLIQTILNTHATAEINEIFNGKIFDTPKPIDLIKFFIKLATDKNSIILDFFAGSGTSGQVVMEVNKDGGNRKFILCQIDEEIKPDRPAYKFCIENNLPPVISSITVERLRRAGEKIAARHSDESQNLPLFETIAGQTRNDSNGLDVGFKVFDTVDAPKLELEDGQIIFQNIDNDPFSRIYNMIFSVGIDNPTATPECILENCMYKIGNNYYITNAERLDKEENKHFLSNAIKSGKIYIDGWTASINTTLRNYKEDMKIVF